MEQPQTKQGTHQPTQHTKKGTGMGRGKGTHSKKGKGETQSSTIQPGLEGSLPGPTSTTPEQPPSTEKLKHSAYETLSEAKNVALRTFNEAETAISKAFWKTEKLASSKLQEAWKSLHFDTTGAWEAIYRSYLTSALKYDEAKLALSNLSLSFLEAQSIQWYASAKNACEKQELLNRWLIAHKGNYDSSKKSFLIRDQEWVDAALRSIELGRALCYSYQDAFDEALTDYTIYLQKFDRCNERLDEFMRTRGTLDESTFTQNRKNLKNCRKTTERKLVSSKIFVEDLRHKILHFNQDSMEVGQDYLDFAKARIPDYEKLSKTQPENSEIRKRVDCLLKRTTEVRNHLDDLLKSSKERLPQYQTNKNLESITLANFKMFEKGMGMGTSPRTSRVGAEK